jgi:fatty-acyl-CoA synthase
VFEVQFAAMRLGALFVPLNWRPALEELAQIGADAEPAVLVHDSSWADTAEAIAARILAGPRLSWGDAAAGSDYEQALNSGSWRDARFGMSLEDATHILYTSGTTGLPEGAISTHGTLAWQAMHCALAADRLARYKLPKYLELVEESPRNVTGKVSRHTLRERHSRVAS